MLRLLVVLFAVALGHPAPSQHLPSPSTFPATGDEFVGPFSSWTNVKTDLGATGDGINDDTAAIQRGLNQLDSESDRSPVLYFPAGRYRLTSTLNLTAKIYVSLVGEDPARTILLWDGPGEGTMLVVNGVDYSKFTRFRLDGRRRASIALDQSCDGEPGHFDTGNEYSENRFVDAGYGIHGGFQDRGFAESSIL